MVCLCVQIHFLIDQHCETSITNLWNHRKCQIRLMSQQGVYGHVSPQQNRFRFWKNSNIAWLFIIVQFYYWVKCIGCFCVLSSAFSARPLLWNLNQKLVKPSECQIHLMFLEGVYDYMSDPMRHSTAHQNRFRNKCDCPLKCLGDRKCQKRELGAHNIFSAST